MKLLTTFALAFLTGSCCAPIASACATSADPADRPAQITGENAIIVWNNKTQTENFIRRAAFHTNSHDFGFLVPTPTRPTLSADNDYSFGALQQEILPEHIPRTRFHYKLSNMVAILFGPGVSHTFNAAANSLADDDDVNVLENKQIGKYRAAVLSAHNPLALEKWLKSHHYATSRSLKNWLAPYVRKNWIITAFKINKIQSQSSVAESDPVRFSFHTSRPFFPYGEPSEARKGKKFARSLKLFYIGENRPVGKIDAPHAPAWPGKVVWSDKVKKQYLDFLAGDLEVKSDQIPPHPRLTVFQDNASPRPGVGDLYFSLGPNQKAVTPEPIIDWKDEDYPIPVDFLGVCGLIIYGLWRSTKPKHPKQIT